MSACSNSGIYRLFGYTILGLHAIKIQGLLEPRLESVGTQSFLSSYMDN